MQFCQRCFALVRQGEQQCRSCGAVIVPGEARQEAGEGAERRTSLPSENTGETATGPEPAVLEADQQVPEVAAISRAEWESTREEGDTAHFPAEPSARAWGQSVDKQADSSGDSWEDEGAWHGEMAEQASRLGSLPTSYSERLILQSTEEEERVPQTAVEAFLQGGVTWLRRLIYVGVVTALLTAMTTTLIRRNRASQAESFVKAQIGAKQLERQQELREAHKALQELYAELKEQGGVDPAGSESARAWRILWRQRLQEVVMRYRLDGQVDFTRTHATAEAVLRDAQLYLHSLEREWVSSVDASSPLSQKLDECLKEARDDLY